MCVYLLKLELARYKALVEKKENDILGLKLLLRENYYDYYNNKIQELMKSNEEYESLIKDCKYKNEILMKTLKERQNQLDLYENEFEELSNKCLQLEHKNNEYSYTVMQMKQRIEELHSNVKTVTKENDENKAKVKKNQTKINDLEQIKIKKEMEIIDLNEKHNQKLQEEIKSKTNVMSTVDQLSNANTSLKNTIKDQDKIISEKIIELEEVNLRLEECQQDMNSLDLNYKCEKEFCGKLKEEVQDKDREIDKLRIQLKENQGNLLSKG